MIEPTAAAYALMYQDMLHMKTKEVTIIFDLGGGTFDVSVIQDNDDRIDVIANEGNIALGGENVDSMFQDFVFTKAMRDSRLRIELESIRSNDTEWTKLLEQCSHAKVSLQHKSKVSIDLHEIDRQYKSTFELFSSQLKSVAQLVIDRTISHVDKALKS